jgi:hypothetical protein
MFYDVATLGIDGVGDCVLAGLVARRGTGIDVEDLGNFSRRQVSVLLRNELVLNKLAYDARNHIYRVWYIVVVGWVSVGRCAERDDFFDALERRVKDETEVCDGTSSSIAGFARGLSTKESRDAREGKGGANPGRRSQVARLVERSFSRA